MIMIKKGFVKKYIILCIKAKINELSLNTQPYM